MRFSPPADKENPKGDAGRLLFGDGSGDAILSDRDDSQESLIEAAVRPFSDNAEMRCSAAGLLGQRVTANAATAAAMVTRWNEVDGRKRKPFWRLGLWISLVVVSVATVCSDFDGISRLVEWGKWISGGSIFTPLPDSSQRVASKLNESEKLLLFGDLTKARKSERKETLWRSEPENPAYFADYAGAYLTDNDGKLPPDFLEIARRIDPTNAWFTYLAAAVEAKDSVESKVRKCKRVDGKIIFEGPPKWEILDQARLDRVMALLREARNQPKYNDYRAELLRRRLPLLSQESSIDQIDSISCLSSDSVFSSLQLVKLAKAISAKANSLGEAGEASGFQDISSDGDLFLQRVCSAEAGTLDDELVRSASANQITENFGYAAENVGLAGDAARWKTISNRLIERKWGPDSRKFIVDGKVVEPGMRTGGLMAGTLEYVAKKAENQPPLTDADLKPMRLHDHEFLSRLFGYVSWLVMVLCLGFITIYRFRVAVLSRRLARRMEDLLESSDWGWIIAVGVVLPFAYVMAVNRLTPLGGRDFGIRGTLILMPAGHFLGLWFLWLILPAQIVRWRLAKRAVGLGFPRPSWMGWLAFASAAAFVPMIGWAAISHSYGAFWIDWMENIGVKNPAAPGKTLAFWLASALLGVLVLWVMISISVSLLGRADRQVYRTTSSFVLIKAYAAILLVIVIATSGFKASQHYWFQRDTILKFDASRPGLNVYEYKVSLQMRTELREILGYDSAR